MPRVAKIWLGGFVPVYCAAKVHTWLTFDSGHYIELHWLFWAAMAGWTALAGLADLVLTKLGQRRSSSKAP